MSNILLSSTNRERERERERDYALNVEYLFLESTDRGTEFNNGYFVDKQFAAD
jgi:hypothetical protein